MNPKVHRRTLLAGSAAVIGASMLSSARADDSALHGEKESLGVGTTIASAPVVVPNGWALPSELVGGVRVFHLVAEEVEHEFAPGLSAHCWGYNGSVHGPTLEATVGERVRIYVTNRLSAPTSVHWHGILVPSGMDGIGGLSQPPIPPRKTYVYEFDLTHPGSFMYHSHHDEMTQIGLGLAGLFIVHPREITSAVDRDFAIQLHEWAIDAGAARPNTNVMSDFNVLTMNAKIFPATQPLLVRRGDRVRIRLGNSSAMSHHPIHLHGNFFEVVEMDGGTVPSASRVKQNTVLVPVGSTRVIEFQAEHAGDWALHCHMTHHVMTQMGHGLPSGVGVKLSDLDARLRRSLPGYMSMGEAGMGEMADMDMPVPANSIPMRGGKGPYGPITMGGMFTILKVRESLLGQGQDPGWYQPPHGTVARECDTAEMLRDKVATHTKPARLS